MTRSDRRGALPRRLDNAALDYEPVNEQGVVFLFAAMQRRFGLRVERVQAAFPDCIAVDRSGKKIRIEFEYKSRNFRGHDPRKCDWIVCWEDNWPGVPKGIRVLELRRELGIGFNVWVGPLSGDSSEQIGRVNRDPAWSVDGRTHRGDLVLFYRSRPEGFIEDVFKATGDASERAAGWKHGKDDMAPIQRVCSLKAPVHLQELRDDEVLSRAGFVRAGIRGRYKVTPYWPRLYQMILERNPSLKAKLRPYAPDRIH
jgi:hypothetical protein